MSITRALCLIPLLFAVASVAHAQPVLNAMTAITPGQWQLQVPGEPARTMCVANPEALFQIRHRAGACTRLVIADEKASATMHYSCPGTGWGRTTVRVSTPASVRIATQGIADNAPFDFTAQARRIGDCPARSASR
ncbi:DUF3617 domain-containing protein [Sphingomonas solaris]|uniref:DUF3617 family protein n=1 Tax=Alterirhizorhabdus solaris TaxID=2529389 RepID=A0A558R6M8_9SPHN|nr:DUF3617 family protein [Sphingomonas solaris]TVV75036.1 hypothetical protein FOY91_08110 [Sphingomonas solaris]